MNESEALLVDRREAAKMLGISVSGLGNHTRDGTIPHVRIGNRVLYSVEALRQWIRDQSGGEAARPPSSGKDSSSNESARKEAA